MYISFALFSEMDLQMIIIQSRQLGALISALCRPGLVRHMALALTIISIFIYSSITVVTVSTLISFSFMTLTFVRNQQIICYL